MKARIIITAIAALFTGTVASAQNLSAYYNSLYLFSNEANPAFAPDCKNYVALPGIQIGVQSNIGAYSLLYPNGNGFVTGLHQSVSSEEFLSRIGESANLSNDGTIRLFGVGGKIHEKSYLSASIKLRESADVLLPYDTFRLLKEGSATSDSFNLSDAAFSGNVLGEIDINLMHSFGRITVGATAKVINGFVRGDLDLDKLNIVASPEKWSFEGEGKINTSFVNFNPGLALDLGVNAHITDNLVISAAVLDLGGITWATTTDFSLPGGRWEYSGIDISTNGNESEGIGSELESAINGLTSKLELVKSDNDARYYTSLPVSANAGIKYTLPAWDKLSFGAVVAYKGNAIFNSTDARAIIDVHPLKWFEVSASAGTSTEGPRGGVLAVISIGPLRAHMGAEMVGSQYGKYSGLSIPIDKVRMMADFGLQLTVR